MRFLQRRDHPRRAREPGRHGARVELVHARRRTRLKRSIGGIPRLYQKYIGHDNNRDFYMLNQPESENIEPRIQYHEWFPQIVYNHHQTGPAGTVMFAPPFRDPFNYNFDPLDPDRHRPGRRGDARRASCAEDKPGVTMRTRRELFDVVERRPAHDRRTSTT